MKMKQGRAQQLEAAGLRIEHIQLFCEIVKRDPERVKEFGKLEPKHIDYIKHVSWDKLDAKTCKKLKSLLKPKKIDP